MKVLTSTIKVVSEVFADVIVTQDKGAWREGGMERERYGEMDTGGVGTIVRSSDIIEALIYRVEWSPQFLTSLLRKPREDAANRLDKKPRRQHRDFCRTICCGFLSLLL